MAAAESEAMSRQALTNDAMPMGANATARHMGGGAQETLVPRFDSRGRQMRPMRLAVRAPSGRFTPLADDEDVIEPPSDGMSVLSLQSRETWSIASSADTALADPNIAPAGSAQRSSTIETLEPREDPATSVTTQNLGSESMNSENSGDSSEPEAVSTRAETSYGTKKQGERKARASGSEPEVNSAPSACTSREAPANLTASAPELVQPRPTMSIESSASSDSTMETASVNSSPGAGTPATGSSATKRTPVSPEGMFLYPLSIRNLPTPKADEALFLPADAERTWYTGFVKPWNNFHKEAYTFWRSAPLRDALDEVQSYRLTPPGAIDSSNADPDAASDILHAQFRRETLQGIQKVYTLLMSTQTMRQDRQPNKIWLSDPADEDLSNVESVWKPSYVIKAGRDADDETTRMLGQVEYLGGKPGALTWAISEQYRNSWGSLRCVLGEWSSFDAMCTSRDTYR